MADISIGTIAILFVLLILAFMIYRSTNNATVRTSEPYTVSEEGQEQEIRVVEVPKEDIPEDDSTVNINLTLTNPYYDFDDQYYGAYPYTGYPYWGYGTSYYPNWSYGSYGYYPRYSRRGHWGGHLTGHSGHAGSYRSRGYSGGHSGHRGGGHGGHRGGGHSGHRGGGHSGRR